MAIDITTWGIDVNNTPKQNTDYWNDNIQAGQEVYLPADPGEEPYEFNKITIDGEDNIEFYGEPDDNGNLPVIKFGEDRNLLEIIDVDDFTIRDLIFDRRLADNEGGVWVQSDSIGSTNGTLKNLDIREADGVSCVIVGQGTRDITVEDCTVHGQRHWSGNAKAMFLAGEWARDITFKNCKTFSQYHYDETKYSSADHFDTDNATNVEYRNCTADGEGSSGGVGFWNEADTGTAQETSSYYDNCTAQKTKGGLGAAENSDVVAHNFTFIDCSDHGWAAWARCCGNFELYDSEFDNCAGIQGNKRGGFVIEGAPAGKFIKFKRNEFINTPEGSPQHDNINLYSEAENSGDIEIIDNTFDDNVTANHLSKAKNTVYVYGNTFNGSDSELIKHENQTNYNWIHSDVKESATTTAVNPPTSSTSVSVEYQSNFTSVQYNAGEAIDWMLAKMRDAINADSDAYITADINMSANTITFTQEDASSPDNLVSIYINSSDWVNGNPFDPMDPAMT